jgi:hypothetical protein
MAEYTSSGIWAAEPYGLFRHAMVGHTRLGLSDELANRFDAWIEKYWQRLDGKLDLIAFNAEGLELAQALKQHVGSGTEVVFTSESDEPGQRLEQIINTPGDT